MVTTSVIKSFNETLRKLKIDEELFNKNLKVIENRIYLMEDELELMELKLQILGVCQHLLESYSFIENELNDILNEIDNCKEVIINIKLCRNIYSYPIDSNAICEAQLLKTQKFNELPKNCQLILVYAQDYKIQLLKNNIWLLAVTDQTPITIKCNNIDPISKIIDTNSIMTLQPGCTAFIGTTRVQASMTKASEWHYNYSNSINIPYNCCLNFPENAHEKLDLKPLKISNLNLDDLEIAKHKLDQYYNDLDNIINEPLIKKIGIETNQPPPPPSPRPQISLLGKRLSKILPMPRRRPSIRIGEPIEENETFEFIDNRNTNTTPRTTSEKSYV
ncbi:hypothetical protein PV325_012694 [Microctonus aethiopoides]|nr:hypothetical protein PV325_012694 [Microctonus aethiopoides]